MRNVASQLLVSVIALGLSTAALAGEGRRMRSPAELTAFGKELLDKGHPEAAIAFLEEATAVDPSHADAYLALGDAYALSGRVEKAIASYEKFLALSPADPRAADVVRYVQGAKPPARKPGKS